MGNFVGLRSPAPWLFFGLCGFVCLEAATPRWQAGPFAQEFSLTLTPGHRTEWVGPFHYRQRSEGKVTRAIPPLFSRFVNEELDTVEVDFLYPIMTYDRFGAEYRWQFLQLLSLSGGQSSEDEAADKFSLFPLYLQKRSDNPAENYTAFLPFYGTLKNRLLRDEIFFVLFPFYSQTRKQGVVTDNYLFPLLHLRRGPNLAGWQFWPLLGHEHREPAVRPDNFGDPVLIPGHDRSFALWPLFLNHHSGIGSTNPVHQQAILPLYSHYRSPLRDSSTYLWPLFSFTDDRERQYREWGAPWPLVGFARGEGKHMNRVWPLFSQASNAVLRSEFYLWPLYKHNRAQAEPLDRERTRLLFFLYSDLSEKNTLTGTGLRRIDGWPLFTFRRDHEGNERLQILSILEPLLPNNKSIERNWSPVWALWRAEKNGRTGAESRSLLWNLWRQERTAETSRTSFLFGLVQTEKVAGETRWHWFRARSRPDATAGSTAEKKP